MDFMQESHPSDDFDARVELYIDAADRAARENHKRLAIHLYIAAFEQHNVCNAVPSPTVLDAMGCAWDIACEIGDKSSAETIFTELSPYSSPEQVQVRVRQLQEMAVDQLRQMGVPDDCIERMSEANMNAGVQDGFDEDYVDADDEDDAADAGSGAGAGSKLPEGTNPLELLKQIGSAMESAVEVKKYADLVGYDAALEQMCVYGFESAGDKEYQRFIRATSEFHGVDGMSLEEPFVMQGPSREDLYEFAEATAGEIGNPVVSLHVRTDDEGMWTMRLSGPFKRGPFGVSDPSDVPTPCTFIVENVDLLQDFIRESARSEAMGYGSDSPYPHATGRGYGEVLGYVHTMMNKSKVFTIATSAASNIEFLPQIDDLFARSQRIEVGYPNLEERKQIWESFAADHVSFATIDLDSLAEISAGVSRHDLVAAGRNAVRDAYRKSISNSDYEFVDINDVLYELVPFVSDAKLGSAIEDAAAMAFSNELEGMLSDLDDPSAGAVD